MTTRTQQGRTSAANAPPPDLSLKSGQLYTELGTPPRLWVGVPTSIAATGKKLLLDASGNPFLSLSGGQMNGDLDMGSHLITNMQAPQTALGAANKAYVDLRAPIASPVFTGDPQAPTPLTTDNDQSIATTAFVKAAISAGPPAGALIGDVSPAAPVGTLWWDSTAGQLYVRYDDGNSQQWVTAANMTGLANAATKADVAPAFNAIGRNLIHNPLFNVAQRGVGPFTTPVMTGDRWNLSFVGDTDSVSPQSILGDADRAGIGDETATFQLVNIFTGNAAAGSYSQITQRVEGVRRLAGTTVTLSFWAKAAATQKLGINATQVFGSGGSPSAAVRVLATGNAVTLSTAWARYSSTFAIPSVSGKTLGTSGGDCTQLELWYSSGATLNAAAGNIGVQSGTIQLWGVQLEIGSVATPLEKPDPRYDVSNCQRFYQAYAQLLVSGYNAASGVVYNELILNTQMRAAPTVAFASQTFSNASVGSLNASAANHLELKTTITATGYGFTLGDVMLSADL